MKDRLKITMLLALIGLLITAVISGCTSGDDGTSGVTPTPSPTGNGVISGTIMDDTGSPIVGANVFVGAYAPNAQQTDEIIFNVTTDADGQFRVEDLTEGQDYEVVISSQGKVTIEVVLSLTSSDNNKSFQALLPNGNETVEFFLPAPIFIAGEMKNGHADLQWGSSPPSSNQESKTLEFNSYQVYRKTSSGVSTSDDLRATINQLTTNAYLDPVTGLGEYYYKVFKRYTDTSGVVLLMASNEVKIERPMYAFDFKWGVSGVADGQFDEPRGIDIYEENGEIKAVYVADHDNNRIQKFDMDGNLPSPPVNLSMPNPYGLTVATNGDVYCTNLTEIHVFRADGATDIWGDNPGEVVLNDAYSIATDGDPGKGTGYIYVTDFTTYSVLKLDANGNQVSAIIPTDPDAVSLIYPTSVAVDPYGNVYVGVYFPTATGTKTKILVFDSNGTQLRSWQVTNLPGTSNWGLDVDGRGNVYYADASGPAHRVIRYNSDGSLLEVFGGPPGSLDGEFVLPTGIAVTRNGDRFYVSDTGNDRVQVFTPQ